MKIWVENNFLMQENEGNVTRTPIHSEQFVVLKMSDHTQVVFVRRKECWRAEIATESNLSSYSIIHTKTTPHSDIFESNEKVVELEIFWNLKES